MVENAGAAVWRILLIDDDEDDYLLTQSMLTEAKGRKVVLDWAPNSCAGREKMNSGRYDAVLVDYDLGADSGLHLIKDLTAQCCAAPLILYTGRGSYEVDMEAIQAGAALYLPKGEATPLLLERSIRYAIERKQAQDSMRESEERFLSLLNNSLDVAYRRDLRADRYDFMSPVVEHMLGFSASEMNQMSIDEVMGFVHPDDRAKIEHDLAEAMVTGKSKLEYRFRTKSGNYCWLADYITVTYDENGQPIYRSGIIRDVTERKAAEERLSDSEERFRSLANSMSQLAWMADPTGSIFWYNQRWYDYTGASPDEVQGWGWQKFHHPDHLKRIVEKFKHHIENGIPWEDTFPIRGRDGQFRWFLSRARPIFDAQGKVSRWFGTNTDVTEQLEAEEAQRVSEERMRLALAAAQQGIWDWNLETDKFLWDKRCRQIIGIGEADELSLDDLIGRVILSEDRPRVEESVQRAVSPGSEFREEFRILHPDGQVVWVSVLGHCYTGEQNQPLRMSGVMQDITERKQAEQEWEKYSDQLKRSNQALEDFAFIASHDLQEPLRKVQAFGHMLKTRFSEDLGVEGADYIDRISSAAARMSSMLNGLLDYSRVTTNAQPFVRVDLNLVAQEVLSDLEVRLMQTGGQVNVDPLPSLQADPMQMHQLFQNMISNALKYHRPDIPPVIQVSGRSEDGHVEISFEDNGIGFDMKQAEIIFQPFRRLVGKNSYDGSGMGLAICHKIVDRHQGAITVHSQPGSGTVFRVQLPLKPSE